MVRKDRLWINWASTEMLSAQWKVSQRRVQQILKEFHAQSLIDIGVLVIDIGGTNPVSKPIYRLVDLT